MASQKKPRIFISRRHGDDPIAKIMFITLPSDCKVLVDELEPGLGKPIREKILRLIAQSTHMIVVWSEASRNSPWINQEIGAACQRGIPVIPLIQRGIPLEAMLEGMEGVLYSPDNWFDGIKTLIEKLEVQLKNDGYEVFDKATAVQRLKGALETYQALDKFD